MIKSQPIPLSEYEGRLPLPPDVHHQTSKVMLIIDLDEFLFGGGVTVVSGGIFWVIYRCRGLEILKKLMVVVFILRLMAARAGTTHQGF